MPLLALQSLASHTLVRRTFGVCALIVSAAALLLTRSRAAWIAALLGTVFPLIFLTAISLLAGASAATGRSCAALSAVTAGVIFGVLLPTQLRWSSSSPYLDTIENLIVHDRGSGLVRMDQYRRSLAMAADYPILGVGPGNWKINYRDYFPERTPPGMWYAARCMSDWIGMAAERGLPATILFFAVLVNLALGCWRSFVDLRQIPGAQERSLEPFFALAILTALVAVSSLDAVMQLPAPTLIVFLSLGALAPSQEPLASLSLTSGRRTFAVATAAVLAAILALYILDGMYAVFLLVRDRGDDQQFASRMALDAKWFYNQRIYFQSRKAETTGGDPSGRH